MDEFGDKFISEELNENTLKVEDLAEADNLPSDEDLEQLLSDKLLAEKLLSMVSPRERAILIKRFWEGKTFQEIADEVAPLVTNKAGETLSGARIPQIIRTAFRRIRTRYEILNLENKSKSALKEQEEI